MLLHLNHYCHIHRTYGEQSALQTPSDISEVVKFLFPCALLCVCHYYIYMVYVQPDNQYHAHSHCVRTLTLYCACGVSTVLTLNRRNRLHKGLSTLFILLSLIHSGADPGGEGSRGSGPPPFCRHVIERDHQQICIAAFMQDV